MKTCLPALLVLLAAGSSAAQTSEETFEGVLEARFDATIGSGEATLYVAPEGLIADATVRRFIFEQRELFLLRAEQPDVLYRVDPGDETYRVLDAQELATGALRPDVRYRVLSTSETEFEGLPVQRSVLQTSEGDRLEIWTSPAIPDDTPVLLALGINGANDGLLAVLDEAGATGGILRLEQYKGGRDDPALEFQVTSVERRELPASAFRLPGDFERVALAP